MSDDDIQDLYNLDTLREMAHRVALERPDGDEFYIRVIAIIQLCEQQKLTLAAQASQIDSLRQHFMKR